MDKKKRRQHYVFQAYLNAWAQDNKVWCVHMGGNPFNTSTLNIAQERDFYRVKPLNNDEIKFHDMMLLRNMSPEVKDILHNHIDTYLEPLKMLERVEVLNQVLTSSFGGNENVPSEIKTLLLELEEMADIATNNLEEDYYSEIEGESIKWLDSLKLKNSSFYNSIDEQAIKKGYYDDERFHFLHFICMQYFRTKAMRERWISSFEPYLDDPRWGSLQIPRENISLENLAHHFFWFTTNMCAINLRSKNPHLTLLVNETDIPFITSDQPVINLKANYNNPSEEANELIFYYPISPTIAITINDENSENIIKLDVQQANEYNMAIFTSSYNYFFANDESIIRRYIGCDTV